MAFFLGIDGGGSQTSCVVGDESAVLGTGSAGGSNIVRVGEANAHDALSAAIRQACTVAGIAPNQIQKTCVGVAGASRAEVRDVIHRLVSGLVSGEFQVVGDMVTAMEAAFGDGPGVMVIAGTGSVAYGRNQEGEVLRAGGWGFAISDEGSGHWIGREAVRAAFRAADEGMSTALMAGILKRWDMQTGEALVLKANSSADFAELVPTVISCADAGDTVARQVLTHAAEELAELAKIVMRRLARPGAPLPVAMAGGVFRHSALVRQVFYNGLRSEFPDASVNATVIEPVRGALAMARKK